MTTTGLSECELQAVNFLGATNTEFKAEFLRNDFHFTGDKEKRDIYKITLKRGSRKYSFEFGNSLNDSGFYYTKGVQKIQLDRNLLNTPNLANYIKNKLDIGFHPEYKSDIVHYPKTPTAYDVLACLQKYPVGTFEDFCSEFGYDEDSRTAEKTYKAVLKEYNSLCTLFSDEELEQLQEIQ